MRPSHRILPARAIILAASLLGMAACDQSGPASSKDRFITIGSGPPGAGFGPIGEAVKKILTEHARDLGWVPNAKPNDGSIANIRDLADAKVEFALSNSAITLPVIRGTATLGGQPQPAVPLAVVMNLAPNTGQFVTLAGSGIRSMADLKGKRVYLGPPAAGFENFVHPILRAHGIDPANDLTLDTTRDQSSAITALGDGTIQAAFIGGPMPHPAITANQTTLNLELIPFDPPAVDRLLAEQPQLARVNVPANTYRNQTEEFTALQVGFTQIICLQDAPDQLVYDFTRLVHTHIAELPRGAGIRPETLVNPIGGPLHPAARRYFVEAGVLPAP